MVCHHNYCFDANPKKADSTDNSSEKFGVIETNKKDKDSRPIHKYGIVSFYHHEHPMPFPVDTNKDDTSNLLSVTPASNRSIHQVSVNQT